MTSAHAIALLALFVALAGGAYAVSKAPKNSVSSKSVLNGSLTGKDVKDNRLTGSDVDESTLDVDESKLDLSAYQRRGANTACAAEEMVTGIAESGDVTCAADQGVSRVRVETGTGPADFTPNVPGLSVLVLNFSVPTVLGDGSKTFEGGVAGQRLTVISRNQTIIMAEDANTQLGGGGIWNGNANDTLSLVFADGKWFEVSRSDN